MARAPRSNPGGATNDGQPGEASISLRGTEAGSAGKTISAGKRAALTALPAAAIGAIALLANVAQAPSAPGNQPTAPAPLVAGQQVEWWAAFKFNAGSFATSAEGSDRNCPFGGAPQSYSAFSQQYAVATSQNPQLQDGDGLIGTGSDPVGSTFGQIYRGSYHYVVWNDQLYDAPKITGCSKECGSPWGHSKGLLAWDDSGEGLVLQVSTPSWPAAGSAGQPRTGDGNTLGCVHDNNVLVSQHFFALKLSKEDVVQVLDALSNSSVATDPSNPELVSNGGPADIQALVNTLGTISSSTAPFHVVLSSGVQLISKPSKLHVPPWQLVSAELGGAPLLVASWWATPRIPPTDATAQVGCWNTDLPKPGPVAIAQTGRWEGKTIGLVGGLGPNFNHAKLGVSTGGGHSYAIFGDMNQQGSLSNDCASSQNGRGGMFFVVENSQLNGSLGELIGEATSSDPT
jgi:hypothetical protein